MIYRHRTQEAERAFGVINSPSLNEVLWCLRQEEHPARQDKAEGDLDRNWDTIRARIIPFSGGFVYASRKNQTEILDTWSTLKQDILGLLEVTYNAKLVAPHDGPADPFWGRLGLVEGNL